VRLKPDPNLNEPPKKLLDLGLARYSPPHECSPGNTSVASLAKLLSIGPISPALIRRTPRRIVTLTIHP